MSESTIDLKAPRILKLAGALLILAMLCAGATALRAEQPAYLTGLPDLPLMPGLTEIEEAGIAFDKPDGRIVEVYADGAVARQAVRSFYRETLPQLGWRLTGGDSFAREGERLKLEFLDAGDKLMLRFVLTPE